MTRQHIPLLAGGLLLLISLAVPAQGDGPQGAVVIADNNNAVGNVLGNAIANTLLHSMQQNHAPNPVPGAPPAARDTNLVTVARLGLDGRNISSARGDLACQIRHFAPGSPIPATGIELNDIIFALDGMPIRGCADLAQKTAAASSGQMVQIDVADPVKGINARVRATLIDGPPVSPGRISEPGPLTADQPQPPGAAAAQRAAQERQQEAERERQRIARDEELRQRQAEIDRQRAAEREREQERQRLEMQQRQQQEAELARQRDAQLREQQQREAQQQLALQQQRAVEEQRRLLYLTAFLATPLLLALVIYLGRIKPAVSLMGRLNAWVSGRREKISTDRGAYGLPSRFLVSALGLFESWTRGIRNPFLMAGVQIAVYTYFIGALVYAAVVITFLLILVVVGLFLAVWFWGYFMPSLLGLPTVGRLMPRRSSPDSSADVPPKPRPPLFGQRDTTQYQGANWFTEKKVGRTDADGNIYEGSSWFTEKKTGRVDEDGNIYEGSNWFTEKKAGRVDEDGSIYEGSSWFTEKKVGRVDEDGNVYEGSNWFTEKKVGRAEKND